MQQYNISFSGESSDGFYAEGDPNDPDQATARHPTPTTSADGHARRQDTPTGDPAVRTERHAAVMSPVASTRASISWTTWSRGRCRRERRSAWERPPSPSGRAPDEGLPAGTGTPKRRTPATAPTPILARRGPSSRHARTCPPDSVSPTPTTDHQTAGGRSFPPGCPRRQGVRYRVPIVSVPAGRPGPACRASVDPAPRAGDRRARVAWREVGLRFEKASVSPARLLRGSAAGSSAPSTRAWAGRSGSAWRRCPTSGSRPRSGRPTSPAISGSAAWSSASRAPPACSRPRARTRARVTTCEAAWRPDRPSGTADRRECRHPGTVARPDLHSKWGGPNADERRPVPRAEFRAMKPGAWTVSRQTHVAASGAGCSPARGPRCSSTGGSRPR